MASEDKEDSSSGLAVPDYKPDDSVALPESVADVKSLLAELEGGTPPLRDNEKAPFDKFKSGLPAFVWTVGWVDDMMLTRFLRARKLDPAAAHKMFMEFFHDTEDHRIPLMQKYPPRRLLRAVDVFCGDSVHKTDMADRTVLTYPAGKFRVYDYVIRTRDFEYTKVQRFLVDAALKRSLERGKESGKVIDQLTSVVDCDGLGMVHRYLLPLFNAMSKQNERVFPETMGMVLVIRAPSIFPFFWKIVSPWLDEFTRSKVRVVGQNYQDVLKSLVKPEKLPTELGGVCKCAGGCVVDNTVVSTEQYDKEVLEDSLKRFPKLEEATVSPGKVHTVQFMVTADHVAAAKRDSDGIIEVEYFFTADKDIRFHVDWLPDNPLLERVHHDAPKHQPSEAEAVANARRPSFFSRAPPPTMEEELRKKHARKAIVPNHTYQAHIAPVRGELRVFQSGTLLFNFDNYNSWRSKKNIKYGIQVAELKPVTPEEYRTYLGRAE